MNSKKLGNYSILTYLFFIIISYQVVLKAYNALKAQSTRVEQDIKLLEMYQQQALDDPLLFIEELLNQVFIFFLFIY